MITFNNSRTTQINTRLLTFPSNLRTIPYSEKDASINLPLFRADGFISFLFLTLAFFIPDQVTAQDNTPAPAETLGDVTVTSPETENPILETIAEIIIAEPLKAFIAAVFAVIIVPTLQYFVHRSRIKNFFSGVNIPKGHRKNSIMMLGLGGVGKTTLSRRICGDMRKDPSKETADFLLFEGHASGNGQKFDYYVSDYRGQNVGSLITGFIRQQLVERSVFRFGDINTLVLVVDIVTPDSALDDVPSVDHPKIDSIDLARVKENISQWNRTALDAIFGMHTIESLRYVCLFINKKDRLAVWNKETQQQIHDAFDGLKSDLERRCFFEDEHKGKQRYAVFDCFIGSAAQDIPALFFDRLQSLSVPLIEEVGLIARRSNSS